MKKSWKLRELTKLGFSFSIVVNPYRVVGKTFGERPLGGVDDLQLPAISLHQSVHNISYNHGVVDNNKAQTREYSVFRHNTLPSAVECMYQSCRGLFCSPPVAAAAPTIILASSAGQISKQSSSWGLGKGGRHGKEATQEGWRTADKQVGHFIKKQTRGKVAIQV